MLSYMVPCLTSLYNVNMPVTHIWNLIFQDIELRKRLQESEHKLGLSMPLEEAKERAAQLESQITMLDRHAYWQSRLHDQMMLCLLQCLTI